MGVPIDTDALPEGPFRLGEWMVDPQLGRLTSGNTTVGLELKVMDVLLCLARRSGTLVSRQDLIDTVWGAEYISDNTLTHAIARLRAALGCDAKNPTFIETLHRRGYRLLVLVSEPDDTDPGTDGESSSFHVVHGDRRVPLAQGENIIGRIPRAAVIIDSLQVSRRHARIFIDGSSATLEDLDSKNGTFLNGRRLDGPAPLADGHRIGLGSHVVVLQFVATVTTEEPDAPTRPALEA